jgi:5-methylcytosine-specific restriction endonuclease McrA
MTIIIFYLSLMILVANLKFYGYQPRSLMFSPRSSRWRKVRNAHLLKNPNCAICGSDENLTVHHLKSFSQYPELELSVDNLITLCENKNLNCHFVFGHHMRWTNLNDTLLSDIEKIKHYVKG